MQGDDINLTDFLGSSMFRKDVEQDSSTIILSSLELFAHYSCKSEDSDSI